MGRIITLEQAQKLPPSQEREWVYNGLDCTGTLEVAQVLLPRLNERQRITYGFELAQQGPAVQMMARGVAVDPTKLKEMIGRLKREVTRDIKAMQSLPGMDKWDGVELEKGTCKANDGKKHRWPRGVADTPEKTCQLCGVSRIKRKPFNPGSSAQKKHLFYDIYKAKKVHGKKGEVTTDKDAMLTIGSRHPELRHITDAIISMQDKTKQLSMLEGKLTPDMRYMSSFNVGAAWTGRFSSSKNPFGLGGNLQNVTERNRVPFVPDPGMMIGYADLKQAESNGVAHLAGDEKYIEAHINGDVHTYVTRLVWPDMQPPWTGDLKKDKKIAKQLPDWDPVEGHDFRFQSKRIQHGSNFGRTPFGIAIGAKIPVSQAKTAQANYFKDFNKIRPWQYSIGKAVHDHETLVNPLGREIRLMGRPWDDHTVKQGLAFKPQSLVADLLNLAMILIFLELEPQGVQLLAQVHDALLFQFPEDRLDLAKEVARRMQIPIPINGRVMTIEAELAVGYNWGHKSRDNPDGLEEIEL